MTDQIKKAALTVRRQRKGEIRLVQDGGMRSGGKTEYRFADESGVTADLVLEEFSEGLAGRLALSLADSAFWENADLEMERPVTVELELSEQPEKITAMYLFNDWWTRPAFIGGFDEMPERTQIAFLKYPDRCACLIPGAGENYKTCLVPGKKSAVTLEMTACMGGISSLKEPLFVYTEDKSIERAIDRAFSRLAACKGIPERERRRLPQMFRYLGWCSWDAFYRDVSEEKIREKAREFKEKQVPVRWIIIDDGWLSAEGDLLYDFVPERKKFPGGFRKMTDDIRREGTVSWFGVWHALGGYWGGIQPESRLAREEAGHLCRTVNGKLLPVPRAESAFGFYRDWYELLRKDGIDFVKVDGQSAVRNYYENSVPVCLAARELHKGLEGAASYFDGAVINCMGMAMENMLARPSSAVSRNSDDFVPGRERGFSEHLLQNAYNALYQNELYCCDWDMFWTDHKDGAKHSLLRAVSGGPVYFSDKIGETVPEVLKPLACLDGELLMMDRAAKPTEDCVFSDPAQSGVLKLTNTASHGQERKGGGIVVYDLTGQKQTYAFSPSDIRDVSYADRYWVYDFFGGTVRLCGRDEQIRAEMEADGFAWYLVLACEGTGTFLGLTEKYAGFAAVEYLHITDRKMTALIKERGMTGFLSRKEPSAVFCGGEDVTDRLKKKGMLYLLPLEERRGRTQIEVVWESGTDT